MKSQAQTHPQESAHHPHGPLAALLFFFVFLIAAYSAHEPGTWLHIRTGADIIARHAVPQADSFSHTATGAPWSTDSWLCDVLFKHLDRSGGLPALATLKCSVIAIAFALLLPLSPGSPLLAAGVLGLGAVAAWPGMTEAPGLFDFLFLALLIRVLRPKRPFTWATVAQVGVVELLWSNINGSSAFIGLGLVGIKVVKTTIHAGRGERLRFGALLAAALAGLALNPHGLAIIRHTFLDTAPAVRPPSSWLNLYSAFVVAGAAATWICLQQEFFLAVSAAGLLVLSLVAPVQQPLYILAACPLIALALGHFLHPLRDTAGRVARLALAFAALFVWHWQTVYVPLGRVPGYGRPALEGAVNYLKANGVTGRMFNEPETGDELLALSGRPVFVDSRADLYGTSFMNDAERWPARFRQLAEAYRFNYVVIRNRRAAYPARVLDEAPDWRLAYADDAALVYLRRSSPAGWLVAAASRRLVPPNQLWPDDMDALLARPPRGVKVLAELDAWILQSPESAQPLLWKAYALDRMHMSPKADRLLDVARGRIARRRDPELMAQLASVLQRRGQAEDALRLYQSAARLARRQGERGLEAALSLRLAAAWRQSGDTDRADRWERRAKRLALLNED
ncbi:MAG: tetratricopeptide repeat protein [Elusimicrobia bacterium]|nr:tetratricopeptide repeat protein [Elusimicrobiota bacterium]